MKIAIKTAVAALVVIAVARQVSHTLGDLRARGESIRISPSGFAAAAGLYIAGLVPLGLFYGRVLAASKTPIGAFAATRAYLISHLGKYVPGTALVVVMRAGLSTPGGARPATAAFATLYETLTMMAAGGLLAAVAFGGGASVQLPLPFGGGRALSVPLALLGLAPGSASSSWWTRTSSLGSPAWRASPSAGSGPTPCRRSPGPCSGSGSSSRRSRGS